MKDAELENPGFYDAQLIHHQFDDLSRADAYKSIPENWVVFVADIVDSTGHVAAGRFKLVNTVGAAVISAQINAAGDRQFPFIFGGDGAAFAFWPEHRAAADAALAAVRRWAKDEFGLELRAASVPVSDIREAGYDVAVARFSASDNADYAMFSGGGVSWAEKQMKSGRFDVPIAAPGTLPDLTGLSCRWTPSRTRNGSIVSVVVLPEGGADPSLVADALSQVVEITDRLERGGHPVADTGPGFAWPPDGLTLEAHATRGKTPLLLRRVQLLAETFIAWLFFITGLKAGGFDPAHYVATTGRNADFRKFEDGLKMTVDCDAETGKQLKARLQIAADAGLLRFGWFEQDAALLTCIVPSVVEDDHIHFIDGASGGYTKAASQIKDSYVAATTT